jgi:hypothetical protein
MNETSIFADLKKLTILHLGRVLAMDIDINRFPQLPELTFIWLDRNHMRALEGYENIQKKFPKLEQIDIGHNLFSCEYLQKLVNCLKSLNITARQDSINQQEKRIDGITCKDTIDTTTDDPEAEIIDDKAEDLGSIAGVAKDLLMRIMRLEKKMGDHEGVKSTLNTHTAIITCLAAITMAAVMAVTFISYQRIKSSSNNSVHLLLHQERN